MGERVYVALCRVHHQQGVTRWLKNHCSADTDVAERKAAMKKRVQINDSRTVKRRLTRGQEQAPEWGIAGRVELTENLLPNLLPSQYRESACALHEQRG